MKDYEGSDSREVNERAALLADVWKERGVWEDEVKVGGEGVLKGVKGGEGASGRPSTAFTWSGCR